MTRLYKPDYLERAVFDVLDPLIDVDLAYANQQHHQLTPPYATLSIDTRVRQGRDTVFTTLDDGTVIYHGTRHGAITLTFVGDYAAENGDDLVNALQRPDASALFRKFGPVLHSATPINIRPDVTDQSLQSEVMCVVDMQFRANVVHAEFAGLIEYLVVRYDVMSADGRNLAHDAIVAALQNGKLEDKAYAVVLPLIPAEALKVGGRYPHDLRVLPVAAKIDHVSYDYDPDRLDLVDVNGQGEWHFLKAGPARLAITVKNKDGSKVYDETILQITA